ncbi:MAG: PAS domain S-box protein, partial [Actinomycetes bacterium]
MSAEDAVRKFVDQTLPFHCELDEQLRIVTTGSCLAKISGRDLVGERFSDHFICDSLHGTLSAEILRGALDSLFIARHRDTDVLLRGQLVEPPNGTGFIVAWAPWFTSLDSFQKQGLTLADFGIMDPIVDVLHLLQAFERAATEAAVPNRRMERFFSLAPDLMLISDPSGSLTLVNPAVYRMLGYSPSEFMANPLPYYVHPDDRSTHDEMFSMLTRGLPAVDVNLRLRTNGGGWRSTRWTALADLQENLIYATARDVSASVEARELSNRILATSPNAIMTIDSKGKITYANPEVTRLFGYSHDELVGNKIEMLVPTESRTKHPALRDRFTNAELGDIYDLAGVSRDVVGQTASGERIPVQITLTKITTEGKTQTLASVVDISGRKTLETELLAARDAAVTLARAKTDFIANTSHEIRTPLTAVIALTELLLATPLNDEQRDLVSTSQAASERLLSLINNVLTFSKSEAGKMEDEVVVFRPAELAAECVQIFTPAATACGLDVQLSTADDLPKMVEGDREKLRSILLNIIGNA